MKLVLLPGMDGTGNLFAPVLAHLSEFDCEVIALPFDGPQDYVSLTEYVRERLPQGDFILVAESFSGPIGALLAANNTKNMLGIIFVATFLSPPNKMLLNFARKLPLKFLASLPLASYFLKMLFLGFGASESLLNLVQKTILALPSLIIKSRLSSMQSLVIEPSSSDLPTGYIQATSDRLVASNKVYEFDKKFSHLMVKTVHGPHFILQAKPNECAVAISELVTQFNRIISERRSTD